MNTYNHQTPVIYKPLHFASTQPGTFSTVQKYMTTNSPQVRLYLQNSMSKS